MSNYKTLAFYIIIFFIISLFYFSYEIRNLNSFYFKKNDEMHARFINLKSHHKNFINAKDNVNSLNFIRQMNYAQSLKSYSNSDGRSPALYFHSHWGLDRGKQIYNLDYNILHNENIFRLSYDIEKYLNAININLPKNCKKLRTENVNLGTNIKELIYDNKNVFQDQSNSILIIEAQTHTVDKYVSIIIKNNKTNELVSRSEIDMKNDKNPINKTYAPVIYNNNSDIIMFDSGYASQINSKNLMKFKIYLYINKFKDFEINLESYNDIDTFKNLSNDSINEVDFNKLNNESLLITEINKKQIFCQG
jgi:hypothetical protein